MKKIYHSLWKLLGHNNKKRKLRSRGMISIRETEKKKFKKRKGKALRNVLRKISVPFSKTNMFYYSIIVGIIIV